MWYYPLELNVCIAYYQTVPLLDVSAYIPKGATIFLAALFVTVPNWKTLNAYRQRMGK